MWQDRDSRVEHILKENAVIKEESLFWNDTKEKKNFLNTTLTGVFVFVITITSS